MKHLDDGLIAELIDSAGGRAGGPAGREAEEHLAECAVCRERVEEARQVAARARSILATAVPGPPADIVVPPFEEILHRAGRARGAGRRAGAFRWLAWAATLVVAGGLGWYARGELRQAAAPTRAAPAALADLGAEADTFRSADEERRGDRDSAPRANERLDAAVSPGTVGRVAERPPERQEEAAAQGFAARDQVAGTESKAAAPPPPSAPAPLPLAQADAARRIREAPSLRATPPAEAEQAPGAAVTTGLRSDMLDRRIVATREQAEQTIGGPLAALEGLPIEGYYVLPAEPGVVQTQQRLPRGGTLELEQWRTSTPRSQLQQQRARAAQNAQVFQDSAAVAAESLQVDGLNIVVRSTLPPDSLRALLRRIRRP